MEPAGEHGVLHAHATAHGDTTAHDDTKTHDAAQDTASHDAATSATATSATTSVRQNDNAYSTINGWSESTVQRNGGSAHGAQLLKDRGG